VKTSMITVDRVSCRLILVSSKPLAFCSGTKRSRHPPVPRIGALSGEEAPLSIADRAGGHVRGRDRGGAEWAYLARL
jgi:hypothetical protein